MWPTHPHPHPRDCPGYEPVCNSSEFWISKVFAIISKNLSRGHWNSQLGGGDLQTDVMISEGHRASLQKKEEVETDESRSIQISQMKKNMSRVAAGKETTVFMWTSAFIWDSCHPIARYHRKHKILHQNSVKDLCPPSLQYQVDSS